MSEKEPTPAERARATEALRRAVEGDPGATNLAEAMAALEDQTARLKALRLDHERADAEMAQNGGGAGLRMKDRKPE